MPLSELCGMARGGLESAQQKTTTCLTGLTSVPDNEFGELVWENGQIVVRGQSNRAKRTSTSNNFQSQTPKPRDKDIGNANNSKMGKFAAIDSVLNDFAAAVPSPEAGLDQDDDVVPWLNYPIENSLQHEYCSELLPELSGVSANELPVHYSFASIDKRNTSNQTIRSSHGVSVHNALSSELVNAPKVSSSEVGESARSRSGQFYPWSFQESQTSVPSLRLGVSSIISNSTSNSAGDFPSAKIQKQDSGLPNGNSGIINFSHFSRPAALVRVNHQNNGAMATHVTSGVEGMGGKNKGTRTTGNFAESTIADLSSGPRKEMSSHSQPSLVLTKVDSKPLVAKPLEETCSAQQSEAICRDHAIKVDKLPDQAHGATASKQMPDGEKTVEPVVAAPSVCSGNSADRASNDPTHNLKRKGQETDDSEGRSEDIEEESVGIRKAAPTRGSGCKRSRAAEVHNLSERRRRDRINEKMRVLQELIPNCNKVDKASMLDEAIEYLKTLQLQVQMMSMGAGLYMPPVMFPTGIQHLHAAYMAHLSRMSVGMGMGFGMGITDMNGGSPGCPMMHGPPMHGAHFPAPRLSPISGPISFQGIAGPNLQVFGHPGQGFPVPVPRFPLVPLSGGPPINSYMGLNVSGMTAPVDIPNSPPSSTSKDFLRNTNRKGMHNTAATSSMNQTSSQHQATNESREQSSLALKKDLPLDVGSSGDVSLTKENDIVPSRPGCRLISGAKVCHRRTGIDM